MSHTTELQAEDILLKAHISIVKGVIYIPDWVRISREELEAINYLLDEWDYGFENKEYVK